MESRLEIDIEERTEMLGQMADILMKRQVKIKQYYRLNTIHFRWKQLAI